MVTLKKKKNPKPKFSIFSSLQNYIIDALKSYIETN